MSNAPSKPVSFSRPKVGYFSNRPRICYFCADDLTQNTSSIKMHFFFLVSETRVKLAWTNFHVVFYTFQISNFICNETTRHALKNRAELNGNLMTHFESCIIHRAEISWKLKGHLFYEFQCRRGFYEDPEQYIMAPPSFR